MEVLRFFVHYGMHFLVPGFIAFFFFREQWKKVYIIFLLTMLIDLDHLLATPILDANRCSINFHPLHTSYAMGVYTILLLPKKTRIIAIGLLFHMVTDTIDCAWI